MSCGACGFVFDVRAAEPALQRALDAVETESAQLVIARALVEVPGMSSQRYVRDWLLKRIPMSHSASSMAELLGQIEDAQARSEATRLAVENFRQKKLPGRWEVTLACVPTPEARRALLTALTDRDDTVRWTAAHAILEYWQEVPTEALPALGRVLKNRREHPEIRFCAAGALARRDDAETRSAFLPVLLQAVRQLDGADADEFPPPTRAAALLCGVSDAAVRREALEFLRERLPNGSEPVLALVLPPLLADGAEWLVAALIAACQDRHPRSPSASTLARSFGELRSPRLRYEAWLRLREALGPQPDSAAHPSCLSLISALGLLRRVEAVPYLIGLLEASEDPAVRETTCESLARLGDLAAVRGFTDTVSVRPEDARDDEWLRRAQRAAEVLADVQDAKARPFAINALVRALAEPALAREAARGLHELAQPVAAEPRDVEDVKTTVTAAANTKEAVAGSPPPSRSSVPLAASDSGSVAEDGEAQREHRLVVLLEDVQRQVGELPHHYFAYQRLSSGERGEKERRLRLLMCGSVRVLMDTMSAVAAATPAAAFGPTVALAYFLQARVHHALACDANGRDASPGTHAYQQRIEHLTRAEESYRQAIETTELAGHKARAYFALGTLLAEADRCAEAMTAFEAVGDLDVTGPLGQAAEQNLKRLQAGPLARSEARPARRGGRRSPARLVAWSTAVAGTLLWAGWVQSVDLGLDQAAIWHMVKDRYRRLHLPGALSRRPRALGQVVVSAKRLRVRSGRGRRHPVLHTARRGQRLTVIAATEGWWKVQNADGSVGWTARRFTSPLAIQK